ncbi:ABC transporter ATP-binding protein [Flaviflexus huanghaiensis]|uniref:ABC transporter ATP-binding protein n=1 Tax=Flaviflexus huanghaiensis TaxID=1111473 RepID=UPI0015FDEB41|nr:ABC transporter ATP-binding protein [Flaviflexus huanghaiensis]
MLHALEVDGLVMAYGGRRVVDDVSFAVAPGTIAAILGPNGAGKTTTVEICEGLRKPDKGAVRLLGLDRARDDEELRRRVGVMLQDGGLPQSPRARAVLTHVSRLHANPTYVDELMNILGLAEHGRTRVRHLSGGQRQRLALACSLVGSPELVFLDEPSSGLDPASRRDMHHLIRQLAADGTTVVLTTHLMSEAEALADQVIVLRSGHVLADGPAHDLLGGRSMWIEGGDVAAIRAMLARELPAFTYRVQGTQLEVSTQSDAMPADLARLASALDRLELHSLSVALRPKSLEDLYFELVEAQ